MKRKNRQYFVLASRPGPQKPVTMTSTYNLAQAKKAARNFAAMPQFIRAVVSMYEDGQPCGAVFTVENKGKPCKR